MKRSEESKKKMSEAAKNRCKDKPMYNKGKVYCYNPETLERIVCFLENIPNGWIRGYPPKEKNCGPDIVEKW